MKDIIKTAVLAKKIKDLKSCELNQQEQALNYLNQFFSEEKGLFRKIAQIMSSNPEANQKLKDMEVAESKLLEKKVIQNIIVKSLGSLAEEMSGLSDEGISASIGQVHKFQAKGIDKDFAVKVQYPNIRKEIYKQLKLLKRIGLLGDKTKLKKWEMNTAALIGDLERQIESELNYYSEAKALTELNRLPLEILGISSPKVIQEYTRENILVTEWMPGSYINQVKFEDLKLARRVAEKFLRAHLYLFFRYGFIQQDPNLGNYLFDGKTDYIGMIDMGNTSILDTNQSLALFHLIRAVKRQERINYLSYFVTMGFKLESLQHIEQELDSLCQLIFEPFSMNKNFNLSNWALKKSIDDLLGERKWWFRSAGGAFFFSIMRSIRGIVSVLQHLPPINWYQVFSTLEYDLKDLNHPEIVFVESHHQSVVKSLKITVMKDGKNILSLMFPIQSLNHLNEIIPEDIKEELHSNQVDYKRMAQDKIQAGFPLGDVFRSNTETKTIVVEITK